jgi:hypothetical protein
MKLFSQSAHALTIPECTDSGGEKLLFQRTDFGLVTDRACTSTVTARIPAGAGASNLYNKLIGFLRPDLTYGNFIPVAGFYAVGQLPELDSHRSRNRG